MMVVRLVRPRAHRVARRMKARGWPDWLICHALGLSRRRLACVLAGNTLWSGDDLALQRELSACA